MGGDFSDRDALRPEVVHRGPENPPRFAAMGATRGESTWALRPAVKKVLVIRSECNRRDGVAQRNGCGVDFAVTHGLGEKREGAMQRPINAGSAFAKGSQPSADARGHTTSRKEPGPVRVYGACQTPIIRGPRPNHLISPTGRGQGTVRDGRRREATAEEDRPNVRRIRSSLGGERVLMAESHR